ncbi:MAG: outer membrane beta-barrel protein, partial [Bacteroidota bacterium]|nr:outer membrane beta-barrel protein [Bacteroidota bacterium]
PNPYNPTQTAGTHPFTANPGDKFDSWDASTTFDFMPNDFITWKFELVHREANVPYFAGHGGVTSPDGYVTTPIPPNWMPDLVKAESRYVLAMIVRF